MQDEAKTKKQLLTELRELRQRLAESKKGKGASTNPAELRRRAEERLKARQTETDQRETSDTERQYHELETHQVELAMQNEELRNAMVQIEESRTRYSDLYDFAPVGYLTLDKNGLVLEANLTIARQLGVERSRLVGRPLPSYIVIADRDALRSHLCNILKDKTHQTCEVRFMKGNGGGFHALLDTIFVMDAVGERRVRTSVTDITGRKRAEEVARLRLALFEFSASNSLEELLQKTLDEVGALTNSPIGFYHFVESDQKTLSLQAWSTRTVKEFCQAERRGLHYPIDQAGVWVDCVHERRPVIHNDYQSLPHRKGMPEGHAEVIRELVVPIMRSSRVVAILGIGNKPANYTEEDVEIVSYLADVAWEIVERKQAEVALQKARDDLELRVADRTSELRNANELLKMEITERKQAEEALFESENKFKSFAEQALAGIYIIQDGVFKYVNAKFAQMFGYTVEECHDKPFKNLVYAEDLTTVEEQVRRRTSGEAESVHYTFRGLKKTGQIFHVEVYGARSVYKGTPAGAGTILDITDRMRDEEALLESKARLKIAMDFAKLVHWEYDVKTGRFSFDDQFYALYGTTSEHEGGPLMTAEAYVRKFVPPEESHYVAEEIAKTLATTDPNFTDQLEHRIIRADGEERHIIVRCGVVCDQTGRVVKVRGANQDITERKRAEQELRQIPSRLVSVQEEERKRLASELHDSIGQTLAALKFWVEMVLKLRDAGDGKAALNHLEQFVPILQRSIEETRNIYMGLRPTMLDDVGLVAALEWLRHERMKLYPQCHIEFEVSVTEEEVPENLKVNIFRIAQEALTNIAKHSKAEWVDISLTRNGGEIKLAVSDDGVGMDLDLILRNTSATSLGFTSMRERAVLSGGSFLIESTPSEGTTIRALWPIEGEDHTNNSSATPLNSA